ncbi:hypothetical protein AVEN_36288-1 [Araneus ventricosus]|uniref:Uncharacterized protein n=1 Tax=Araneus ventricosus TaxID=182803 RepID=A0A4Y2QGD9_ARAVE|nr:hypothetical protein AVEN_106062-1 [Araneus ventricosus]GBN62430.1 hypothetical protein AVEN_36288-1 [Araneus ventricosus]
MKLKGSFYVDNSAASVDSIAELEHFRTETQRILKTAWFDLRGWKNNFLPEIEETVQDSSGAVEENVLSVLGLTWDRECHASRYERKTRVNQLLKGKFYL